MKKLDTDETDVIKIMEDWMLSLDWFPTCKLAPQVFPQTGRGLLCLEDIKANDILMKIPSKLLITISSVRSSKIHAIFQSGESFEAQCILAVFLAYEKHLGANSAWKFYLDTLPSFYTTPDYCSQRERKILSLTSIDLESQSIKVRNNYRCVVSSLNKLKESGQDFCPHCAEPLRKILNFHVFKWAYYTVNTRAVYIDSTEKTSQTDVRIKDSDNMALAPYLDLFNHSYDAAVRVNSIYHNENREYYQLRTLKPFSKGSQVFINYGSHNSLKLFMEYGFFIPNNPLDQVPFDFSHIDRVSSVPQFARDFIHSHNCHKNMGFTWEGLTYNAKIVLFILSTRCSKAEWTMRVYNAAFSQEDLLAIYCLGKKILDIRIVELCEQLKIMEQIVKKTASFEIALELVKEYIRMLNSAVKQFIE